MAFPAFYVNLKSKKKNAFPCHDFFLVITHISLCVLYMELEINSFSFLKVFVQAVHVVSPLRRKAAEVCDNLSRQSHPHMCVCVCVMVNLLNIRGTYDKL